MEVKVTGGSWKISSLICCFDGFHERVMMGWVITGAWRTRTFSMEYSVLLRMTSSVLD